MRLFFSLFFVCFFSVSQAQYKYVFYLNENLASVPQDSALILGKAFPDGDLLQLDCYVKETGRLFMRAHFSDTTLSTLNGHAQTFYENGMMDTEGDYKDGIETGLWMKMNEEGQLLDSSYYEDGEKVIKGIYQYENDTLVAYELKDTKTLHLIRILYNKNGTVAEEADFMDNIGTYTYYEKGEKITVPVKTREITEPDFPGGRKMFNTYIDRNIHLSSGIGELMPSGTYSVTVEFDVDKNGKVKNPRVLNKVGFGLDDEALRLMAMSPKWIPAKRYGITVAGKTRHTLRFNLAR